MARSKIPAHLRDEILVRLAQGATHAACAKWLRSVGISVTRSAISKLAKSTRVERAETTKAVVAEKLAGAASTDLDVLDRELRHLRAFVRRARNHARKYPAEGGIYLQALDRLERLTVVRLKLAGAAETPEAPTWAAGLAELVGEVLS